jgi:prophage maintenance system killer protein
MTSGSTNRTTSTASSELSTRSPGPEDVVEAAAILAYRVARAQGFGEGNKRTALLLARWLLDRNGEDGRRYLPPDDRVVGELLVSAAGGNDVERQLIDTFGDRHTT